jgi:hypothetical protein
MEDAVAKSGDEISPALRFVVLHHTGLAESHFDLMIETASDSKLSTWRIREWPSREDSVFEPLADHRREYLTYEGPISGDRGQVARIAQGLVISIGVQPKHFFVALEEEGAAGRSLILRLPR